MTWSQKVVWKAQKRQRKNKERTLGAQRIRLEQTQVGKGVMNILQKGMSEVECVEACSAAQAEKVACSVPIGSVELLNDFEYESEIIRLWFRKITLKITGKGVEMGRD